ncbi:protein TFG-like [Penaeus japonicus]|uniref:protein TFG-like n=1 Tax=Penaeus japonicus TaxID=27405 RepID=UPI001C7148C9|nr:protein TFG-like [Penaeus japonicus]
MQQGSGVQTLLQFKKKSKHAVLELRSNPIPAQNQPPKGPKFSPRKKKRKVDSLLIWLDGEVGEEVTTERGGECHGTDENTSTIESPNQNSVAGGNMSGAGSSDSGLDLSGKLIIKAQLGDDIRRIPIHNEDMTYDELILMMQRVFRGSLSPDDDITLKYKDEDGDLVTIFDSSDLAFAIQCSRILRLTILPNGQKSAAMAPPFSTLTVRRELRAIRDRVTALLDTLDVSSDVGPKATADSDAGGNSGATASPAPNSNMQLTVSSKEFDPLQASEQQQPTQQQQPKAQTNSQQHPPASTPTPATGAPSEASAVVQDTKVYEEVMSSFGIAEAEASASAGTSQGEKPASASASSTPAAYHLQQQKPQVPPSQQPAQQQPAQQQPPTQQQQQHPGYPGFGAARAPASQHGPYPHFQGQHYGASGDVSGGAAPRSGVPPNTMTPGAAGTTPPVGPAQQQQQYYQGYQPHPQFQGYPVSSSQPGGFPQQYPGQQYPPTYTQAGPPSAGPQPAQPGPPTGPRPPMSRYPTQPSGFQQQWGQ